MYRRKAMESAAADGSGVPPPPRDDSDAHGLVDVAVDSALAAHAMMGSAHHAATAPSHAHGGGGYEHHSAAYGPAPTGHQPPPPPPYYYHGDYSAYDSGSGGYGWGQPPPPPPPNYHQHGYHGGYDGPSPRSQQATAYDYDKPYPSPPNYHYQGASFDYDAPPGGHHGYGPPPTARPPPNAYHHGHPPPPPTAGPGTSGSDPSGNEYSHYYTSQQQHHQQHSHSSAYAMYGPPPPPPAVMGASAEYGSIPHYAPPHDGDSSAPATMASTTTHASAEDFRQVTPRTSDMDDGASASTANTGARSIDAAGAQQKEGGKERREGQGDKSSPSTTTYPTSKAAAALNTRVTKTPAPSNSGTSRGSKNDKSPEEMSAAEVLITTAQQRYPRGHPGPHSLYYPHGGGAPPPPPHGAYHHFPSPHALGAPPLGTGASPPMQPPQTFPSHRDMPSPSAVAAAVVAASKEIADGNGDATATSPEKPTQPDSASTNDATTTPARKRTEGEEDVVGALLEMKTSSAEKKAQQQEQSKVQTSPSEGSTTCREPADPSPAIDPKEWAKLLPLRMSTPNDSMHLNRLHCFIRSTLLELFVMPVGKSIDSELQGQQYQLGEIRHHSVVLAHRRSRPPPPLLPPNRHPHFPFPPGVPPYGPPPHGPLPPPPPHIMAPPAAMTQGKVNTSAAIRPAPFGTSTATKPPPSSTFLRVGFRCVFCVKAQREQAERAARHGGRAPPMRGIAPMGTFYPKNVAEIYTLVARFQRLHFKECRYIPPTIRREFDDHRKNDKSRGRKEYWAKSAKAIGLVDDEKKGRGIRFIPPNAFQQKDPAKKPLSSTGPSLSGAGGGSSSATKGNPVPQPKGGSSAATEPAPMKDSATADDDAGAEVVVA